MKRLYRSRDVCCNQGRGGCVGVEVVSCMECGFETCLSSSDLVCSSAEGVTEHAFRCRMGFGFDAGGRFKVIPSNTATR